MALSRDGQLMAILVAFLAMGVGIVSADTFTIAPSCDQINGVIFTAPSDGTYNFSVTGSYNPWPYDHEDYWTSAVFIYYNRPVQWSYTGWGGEGIPNVYMDYQVTANSPIDIQMNAGDYVTMIAFDGYSGYCGNGYQGGVTVEISIIPTCDCSKQPGVERCFGGVGVQCEGISIVAPFVEDQENCLVAGWMSVGSILHDRCCVATNNKGYSCTALNQGSQKCKREWNEAWYNTQCTALGATRQWSYTFGPYPYGNSGDNTNKDLTAPSGSRVNPVYQQLCSTGSCQTDVKGKTVIKWDQCGKYCECK